MHVGKIEVLAGRCDNCTRVCPVTGLTYLNKQAKRQRH